MVQIYFKVFFGYFFWTIDELVVGEVGGNGELDGL